MATVLIVNGAEPHEPMAAGRLNELLVRAARTELQRNFTVLTTTVHAGYDVASEQRKFREADTIIFQFPVYWFALPPTLKKYVDDVYTYGTFFGPTHTYGRGGLLGGRDYMVSTTWNASATDFGSTETFIGQRTADDVLIAFHLTQQYVGLSPLASFSENDVVQHPDVDGAVERLRQHLRAHVIDKSRARHEAPTPSRSN
ncbi:MAG TPA: NAD(P)H-dependent oxidoreductase [Pseudonocardia sp.]